MMYDGRYQVSASTRGGVYRACLALPTAAGRVIVCAEVPHALLYGLRALAAQIAPPEAPEVGFAPLGGALLGSLLGGGGGQGGGGLGGALSGLLGGGGGQGGGGLGGALSGLLGGGQRQAPTTGPDGRARPGASGGPEVAPGAPPTGFFQAQAVGAPGGGQLGGQTPGGGATPGLPQGGFDPSWVAVAFTTSGVPLYRVPPGVAPVGQSPMGLPIFPGPAALDALAASGGNRPAAAAGGLPGLGAMATGAASGAVPPELAATYLGAGSTLAQGLQSYQDVAGPVALLLRSALRAVDAGAGAELGDARAVAALQRARQASEARVAEALRLAGLLVQGGATPGAAIARVAAAV